MRGALRAIANHQVISRPWAGLLLCLQRINFRILQVTEDSYEQLVGNPNLNKADPDGIEARSVGDAISALSIGDATEEDRHPERSLSAALKLLLKANEAFIAA